MEIEMSILGDQLMYQPRPRLIASRNSGEKVVLYANGLFTRRDHAFGFQQGFGIRRHTYTFRVSAIGLFSLSSRFFSCFQNIARHSYKFLCHPSHFFPYTWLQPLLLVCFSKSLRLHERVVDVSRLKLDCAHVCPTSSGSGEELVRDVCIMPRHGRLIEDSRVHNSEVLNVVYDL